MSPVKKLGMWGMWLGLLYGWPTPKISYWRYGWTSITYNGFDYFVSRPQSYKKYLRIIFDRHHFKIDQNLREISFLINSPEVKVIDRIVRFWNWR